MLLSEFPLMEKPFIKAQIKSLTEHYDDSTVIILSAKEKTILQGSLSMQSDFLRDEFTVSSVLDPDGESYELMKSELFYAGHIMNASITEASFIKHVTAAGNIRSSL